MAKLLSWNPGERRGNYPLSNYAALVRPKCWRNLSVWRDRRLPNGPRQPVRMGTFEMRGSRLELWLATTALVMVVAGSMPAAFAAAGDDAVITAAVPMPEFVNVSPPTAADFMAPLRAEPATGATVPAPAATERSVPSAPGGMMFPSSLTPGGNEPSLLIF